MKSSMTLILSLFLLLISCGTSDPDTDTAARVMVWQFVEGQLKDPGSAEFGFCSMHRTVSGSWETDSYVDAKNGFGGTQRLNFHCEVKYQEDDSWELIELKFK